MFQNHPPFSDQTLISLCLPHANGECPVEGASYRGIGGSKVFFGQLHNWNGFKTTFGGRGFTPLGDILNILLLLPHQFEYWKQVTMCEPMSGRFSINSHYSFLFSQFTNPFFEMNPFIVSPLLVSILMNRWRILRFCEGPPAFCSQFLEPHSDLRGSWESQGILGPAEMQPKGSANHLFPARPQGPHRILSEGMR